MQPRETDFIPGGAVRPDFVQDTLPTVLFVRGCARSGTTLLADIMNEHPNVGLLVEQPLGDLANRMSSILWFEEHRKSEEAAISRELFVDNRCRMQNTLRYPTRERFPEIVAAAVNATFDKPELHIIGSKTPGRWEQHELELVQSLFPRVKYVFVVRNPLATINSMINRRNAARAGRDTWPNEPIEEAIARYQESMALLLSTVAAYPRDCYIVGHEDLLARPGATLAGLSDFLGVRIRDESSLIGGKKSAEKHAPNVLTAVEERRVREVFGPAIDAWADKRLTGRPIGLARKLAGVIQPIAVERSERLRVRPERQRGLLGAGWSGSEPGGVWSEAQTAECFFNVPHDGDYRVRLQFSGFGATWRRPLTFAVTLGNQHVPVTLRNGWKTELVFEAAELAGGIAQRIRFDFGDIPAASERGRSGDPRRLGIKLKELLFERVS
jgi:hypothetical protein